MLKQSFKFKYVALGVILAASSTTAHLASAADPIRGRAEAMTSKTIKGTPPLIVAKTQKSGLGPGVATDTSKRSIDVTFSELVNVEGQKKGRVAVGSKVTLEYFLHDYEDDKDGKNSADSAANSVRVYGLKPHLVNGVMQDTWMLIASSKASEADANVALIGVIIGSDGVSTATFTLPAFAEGVKQIGLAVNEMSDYGDPRGDRAIYINNVFQLTTAGETDASGNSEDLKNVIAADTTIKGTGGGTNGGDDTNPVDPDNPIVPDPVNGNFFSGIFVGELRDNEINSITAANDLSTSSSSIIPQVGKTYTVVAWSQPHDDITRAYPTSDDAIVNSRNNYTHTWKLAAGTSNESTGSVTLNADLDLGTGSTFTIPVNGAIANASSQGLKAGAQGFTLKVVSKPKGSKS